MFRQIEKLQQMVNRLLGLCKEAGADVVIDDIPKDYTSSKYEKLGVFILKSQDGVLSTRSTKIMEKWLSRDEDAQRYYIDFINLTVMLRLHFQPNKYIPPLTSECCL